MITACGSLDALICVILRIIIECEFINNLILILLVEYVSVLRTLRNYMSTVRGLVLIKCVSTG